MNDFLAIDFETADYLPESAISVGIVKYHNYKPLASYYSLIRPPVLYIRPDFTDIHGLTVSDVEDAPDFKYIWENEIRGFFGSVPVAAHNAVFDMKVLNAVLNHYEIPAPETPCFCSLEVSRKVWPELRSHALAALAKHFSITYDAHNAAADAHTCAQIICLAAESVSRKNRRKKILPVDDLLKKTGVKTHSINGFCR